VDGTDLQSYPKTYLSSSGPEPSDCTI